MKQHAIINAATPADLDAARRLFREYADSLPQSACQSLCHQGFDDELRTLPGRYAPPSGVILLGVAAGEPVGAVALREIPPLRTDPGRVCEMKRMYVQPRARGLGLGRALADALISRARAIGYSTMKLDTEPDFVAAVTLYRSLGFREAPRYNDDPVACTLFMSLNLLSHPARIEL